jgi:hypothetical protein
MLVLVRLKGRVPASSSASVHGLRVVAVWPCDHLDLGHRLPRVVLGQFGVAFVVGASQRARARMP